MRSRFRTAAGFWRSGRGFTILTGDITQARLAPGQIDAIMVTRVLEWVGLFDLSAPPEQVQRRFLETLRA
jgi:hypothetical protein